MLNQPKKICILTASAGGGHVSNAKALQAWINIYYPKTNVLVYNVFDDMPHVFGRDVISLLYYVLSVHAPFLWKLFIDLSGHSKPLVLERFLCFVWPIFGLKKTALMIKNFKPDLIISTYAPVVAPLKQLTKKFDSRLQYKLIITDIFSAPTYWMTTSADQYIVMSQKAHQKVTTSIPSVPVLDIPVLLHPKFFNVLPQVSTITPIFRVLLLAGGEGVYNMITLVNLLSKLPLEITIICGKDKVAFARLTSLKSKLNWLHITIIGYCSDIEQELNKTDLVITKAGPATLFEIFRFKKAVICYHFIYGTEQENIDFMIDHNLGFYEPNINKIPELINQISLGKKHIGTVEVPKIDQHTLTSIIAPLVR